MVIAQLQQGKLRHQGKDSTSVTKKDKLCNYSHGESKSSHDH